MFKRDFYWHIIYINDYVQGGGGEGADGAGDDDMDENLMGEEVDNTLHFKGFLDVFNIIQF